MNMTFLSEIRTTFHRCLVFCTSVFSVLMFGLFFFTNKIISFDSKWTRLLNSNPTWTWSKWIQIENGKCLEWRHISRCVTIKLCGVTILLRMGGQGQLTPIHTQRPIQPPSQHTQIHKKLLKPFWWQITIFYGSFWPKKAFKPNSIT